LFELGESLRLARERQGLELSDVERVTRIGPWYLAALEEERFDRLPALAYAKGFLSGYAAFLGLDARQFVEEFDARFAEPQPPVPPPPRRRLSLPLAGRAAVARATKRRSTGEPAGARHAQPTHGNDGRDAAGRKRVSHAALMTWIAWRIHCRQGRLP
jgi:hypothetical protein